jgi:hypothetical protein
MVKLTRRGSPHERFGGSSNAPSFITQIDEELIGRLRSAEPAAIRQLRHYKAESQQKFWSRFGVTQSSGSRFEAGLNPPRPVLLLLELYASGALADNDMLGRRSE